MKVPMKLGNLKVSTNGCARCYGEGHKDLVFEELVHPHEPEGVEYKFTHWLCVPR